MVRLRQVARRYPERKVRMYRRIQELSRQYSVIAVSSLYKVRASQLNEIRKKLRGHVVLYGIKNKLAYKALKELGLDNIDEFFRYFEGQSMLLFTNMNPFKLQLILEKSKVDMPARAGDIAPSDIVVPSGNTGIPPGPILSTFKQFKIPTRIESGSIFVTKDTVVVKAGEVIPADLASLLTKLGLKPIKAGLSLRAAYWKGIVIPGDQLKIDLEKTKSELAEAAADARRLAVAAGYLLPETVTDIIAKAEAEVRQLAIAAAYLDKDILPQLIAKAEAEAIALNKVVESKTS
jgi:large subunit ribosomal protein L10